MVFLVISVCITFLLLFFRFVIGSFKLLALGIDFVLIVIFSIYYFHPFVSAKFLYGNWQYVFDGIFALLVVGLYIVLISLLNNVLPLVSNIVNFIIAYIGLSIAIPFTFGLVTALFPNFANSWVIDDKLIISYNATLNTVIKYGLLLLLTIPVWRYRMDKLNSED